MSRWRNIGQDESTQTDERARESTENEDSQPADAEADTVGVCEDCGTTLPRSHVVMEYETGDEWEQVALCPGCRELAVAETRPRHGE